MTKRNLPYRLLRAFTKRVTKLMIFLKPEDSADLLLSLATHKAQSLSAADAANYVFGFTAALYGLESELAINYNSGTHPKHRLTSYHAFFIERIIANERVLDVGCSSALLAYNIVNKTGAFVDGIDIDAASIEEGKRKRPHANLRLFHADVNTWKPDHPYDVIILSNVLEHLANRSQLITNLVQRTRAPRLLIRVPQFTRDWRVAMRRELGVEWRLDHTHEIEYTLEEFLYEMKKAGLVPIHYEIRWGEIWAELSQAR